LCGVDVIGEFEGVEVIVAPEWNCVEGHASIQQGRTEQADDGSFVCYGEGSF
jgi:hypothetical protein